jgi:CheY-like chemotaxis protein
MLTRLVGEDVLVSVMLETSGARVTMRRGELDQILMNLVANARDAMPKGGSLEISSRQELVTDAARSEQTLEPGRYAVLSVSDTGVGMDEDVAEYALEPFFTTKGVGEGVGLGLPTVYGIVRRAGGQLVIDSEPGSGTTVSLWLPCSAGVPTSDPAAPLEASSGGGTILVVEDEPLVLLTVRHYLEGAGYKVLSARCGAEAEECCTRFPGHIDLLLTDMVLPGISGQALAVRAGKLKPGLATLYMSAHPRETLIASGRLDEDDELLQKPFSEQQLISAVTSSLAAATDS